MDAKERIRPARPARSLPRAAAGVTGMTRKRRPPKTASTAAAHAPRVDPGPQLRRFTAARIGLPRSGASLATGPLLDLRLAHARARDAVNEPFDAARLAADLATLGLPVLTLASAADDRQHYLMRPDLGRRLAENAAAVLAPHRGQVRRRLRRHRRPVGAGGRDPRGAAAGRRAAAPSAENWRIAPLTVVRHGRVAIGDVIAAALGAEIVAVLIGERPGLSSPDSMGAYLTWHAGPRTHRRRPQLHLQHPPRGPRLLRRRLQASASASVDAHAPPLGYWVEG